MPTLKMTRRSIEALPAPDPTGKQTLYWTEGTATPGLGILVSGVSASKSWVCQGNLPSGKSRRVTLGPVAVLTLEQAWDEAKPRLAAMLQGRDPKLTVPQRKLAGMTVAEVFEEYLAANSNLKPATLRMYRSSLAHLGPLLKHALREIDAGQVERQFRAITADVAARRARGAIRGGVNVDGRAIANSALPVRQPVGVPGRTRQRAGQQSSSRSALSEAVAQPGTSHAPHPTGPPGRVLSGRAAPPERHPARPRAGRAVHRHALGRGLWAALD